MFARFAMEEGNILSFIPEVLRKIKNSTIRQFLFKPFVECPICMASVWGSFFYFFVVQSGLLPYGSIGQWVMFCCCLSGFMWLVMKVADWYEVEFKDISDQW